MLMFWKIVSVIIYAKAAINRHYLTSLTFFLSLEVNKRKHAACRRNQKKLLVLKT